MSQFSIPHTQLFLLSSFGMKLKSSSLEHCDEIYVYDKNLFSIEEVPGIQRYILSNYTESFDSLIHPISSPLLDVDLERLASAKNTRQLISLLTTNLGWVAAIESDSNLFHKKATDLKERTAVLFRSLKVASLYIENYCNEVKKSFDASVEFLVNLQKHTLGLKWKENYEKLQQVKTLEGVVLADFLDYSKLENQAKECLELNEKLNNTLLTQRTRISKSNNSRAQVDQDIGTTDTDTNKVIKGNEPEEWLNELKLLSDKVKKDTRHLLDETKDSVDELSLDMILDTFQLHKSQFVKTIYELSFSLFQLFQSYRELFTKTQVSLSSFLHKLSEAQAEMVTLNESLRHVAHDIERVQELESQLAHTADLPLLYGLYIVETVRRSEWLKTMKHQSSKTNENFASLREKEIRARSTWVKNYGDILKLMNRDISDFNSESLVTFELTINDTRQELHSQDFIFDDANAYIQQLQAINCDPEIISVLIKSTNDIPLKLSKITSKSDSVHESHDAVIKGFKGRIKKLESLLHQEQFKNYQQWPSHGDRPPVASRYSINEKLLSSTTPTESSIRGSGSTLQDSGEIQKLTEEARTLKNDLKRHKNTVEILNEELKGSKHQASIKEFEVQTLQKDIERMKEGHDSEVARLRVKISEQEVAKAMAEDQVSRLNEELRQYTIKIVEKDKLITEMETEHALAAQNAEKKFAAKVSEFDALKLEVENRQPLDDVDALKSDIEALKAQISEKDTLLSAKDNLLSEKSRLIDEKYASLKEKDAIIISLTNSNTEEVSKLQEKNIDLEKQVSSMNNNLETLKDNYERLSSMKNDLLENMSNRENEFAKEKVLHQEEIEALKMKAEELEKTIASHVEDIGTMSETHKQQTQTIVQLVVIINSLAIKARDLSDILVTLYDLLCSGLKSMGLLAVRHTENGKVSIIRVKGLKKATGDLSATVDLANGFKPDLEQEVLKASTWSHLPDKDLLNMEMSIESGTASESLDGIVDKLIETYNLTTFEENYLTFVNRVTNLNDEFLISISRRFKEVEHLAKKELKENRKLKDSLSSKISVRNFEVGDLVLFLPTRANGNGSQWAAFNDMDDSKFILKNDLKIALQKQWFIGKIVALEEVGNKEFIISAGEVATE